jgi:endoglucanase
LSKSEGLQITDLHGGWFDAADYNKYTSWTARNVIVLLRAYNEDPAAFGDDSGIAESGNGVPDILEEVKWASDAIPFCVMRSSTTAERRPLA